jgi:WD40 repeat protein/uncharacterized protein YegL
MKRFILLFVFAVATGIASGQSLNVFDIDQSNFPVISAKFTALNEDGSQINNLDIADLEITEHGTPVEILNVSCPSKNISPPDLSCVIVTDVSGSMNGDRLKLAQEAANAFIDGLPEDKFECAITSFSQYNNCHQDFTTSKQLLKNAVNTLAVGGGTRFDAAFINQIAGGLLIAENGRYKKVVVLITDGHAEGSEDLIIQKAKEIDATIFCVTLNVACPQILQNISIQTGGNWYESVATAEQARDIYLQILQIAQNYEPCTVEWKTDDCKGARSALCSIPEYDIEDPFSYRRSEGSLRKINWTPSNSIFFENIKPGETSTREVTIKGEFSDVSVTGFSSNNNQFTISDWGGSPPPFTLTQTDSREITIEYSSLDSATAFGKITIESSSCELEELFMMSFFDTYKKQHPSLKVTRPNGGEIFVAGSDTTIKWEGILPEDTVEINFSSDNGKTWQFLTSEAFGLEEIWNNLPHISSNKCLIEISDVSEKEAHQNDSVSQIVGSGFIKRLEYNHAGDMIALATSSGLTIMDLNQDKIIKAVNLPETMITDIDWSPDDTHLISVGDGNIYICEVATGKVIETVNHPYGLDAPNACWSPDGNSFAFASYNLIKFWNRNTGAISSVKPGHSAGITAIAWNPDGSQIASVGYDYTLKLYDLQKDENVYSINTGNDLIEYILWNPTKNLIIAVSETGSLTNYQSDNGLKGSFNNIYNKGNLRDLDYSPDGSSLAILTDMKVITLLNANDLNYIESFTTPADNSSGLDWSPDGEMIATGDDTKVLTIRDAESGVPVKEYKGFYASLKNAQWHPHMNLFGAVNSNNTLLLWDKNTCQELPLSGKIKYINHYSFSPDGKYLAATSNNQVLIYDYPNGNLINSLSDSELRTPHRISWSPDGKKILVSDSRNTTRMHIFETGGDYEHSSYGGISYGVVDIDWDGSGNLAGIFTKSGRILLRDLRSETNAFAEDVLSSTEGLDFALNPSATKAAVTGKNTNISIIDLLTGSQITSFYSNSDYATVLDWSPNGEYLASGHLFGIINIWDEQWNLVKTLDWHTESVTSLSWSPNGRYLLSSSNDGTARIWDIFKTPVNLDVSDETFSIVFPEITARDIDFGDVLVNNSYDSVFTDYIVNIGTYPCRIDSIYFAGTDSEAFKPVSDFPPYTIPSGEAERAVLRFSPDRPMDYSADLIIETQAGTQTYKVTGRGINPSLKIVNEFIDFGKVEINTAKDSNQVVTVANTGNSDIRIKEIQLSGVNTNAFTIIDNPESLTLTPGDTCKLDFKFSPITVGKQCGELYFLHDRPGSPALVQLFGEGFGIPEMTVADLKEPDIMCEATDTIPVVFKNTGTDKLDIDAVSITGDGADHFVVVGNIELLRLYPGQKDSLTVLYKPKTNEEHEAEVFFTTPDANFTIPIRANKEYTEIELPSLVVIEQEENEIPARGSFEVINKGTTPIDWNFPITSEKFTIEGGSPDPLPAGETGIIQVICTGNKLKEYETDLYFYDNCFDATSVHFYCNVTDVSIPDIYLSVPDCSAGTADVVTIPIILTSATFLNEIEETGLSADLTYNPSMLYPYNEESEYVNSEKAKIKFEIPDFSFSEGDTIFKAKFITALGNADWCHLGIENPAVIDGVMNIEAQNGIFRLEDLCREGGTRLLEQTGISEEKMIEVSPNPAQDEITIKLNLVEKGYTEVHVSDILGRQVKQIFKEDVSAGGERTIKCNISELGTGLYYINFSSPCYNRSVNLQIVR